MNTKNYIRAKNINAPVYQKNYDLKYLSIAFIAIAIIVAICICFLSKKTVDDEQYWLTESTGRIHKSGCSFYRKTKGYHVIGKRGRLKCKKCFGKTGEE